MMLPRNIDLHNDIIGNQKYITKLSATYLKIIMAIQFQRGQLMKQRIFVSIYFYFLYIFVQLCVSPYEGERNKSI